MSKTDEAYVMGDDVGELQRLHNHHDVLKHYMGTLTLAPIDFSRPNLRILDSGTADGLWLHDLQSSFTLTPHTYIGTDITPSFFLNKPKGQRHDGKTALENPAFHIQSITQPWPQDWLGTFDYVHQRLTLPGAGQHPIKDCVLGLVGLVRAGGWIELVEADFYSADDSGNGPVLKTFEAMMQQFLGMGGVGYNYARPLRGLFEEAGLVEVGERVFDIGYGAIVKDEEIRRKGVDQLVAAARGLSMFTKGRMGFSMSNEEVDNFPNQVQKELEERGARFRMVAVWAQKPTE